MMLSMTAFSRQQLDEVWGSLTWEIRSVNHRYLETSVRLPELFRSLENPVREELRKQLNRGKVECQLRYQSADHADSSLELDHALIRKLVGANLEIESIASVKSGLSTLEILRWPGVIKERELDTTAIEQHALALFKTALADLITSRRREGEELRVMVQQRIDAIRGIVASVRTRMPDIIARQKQNLLDRIAELGTELDPTRLELEVSLLAQKADVAEELDRLDSHLKEVERVLATDDQKGRRLDFLMQELNREANTLSSKSAVVETTLNAVELKVLIEQMREQIQNIE
jgi:uncharacterized protein (TIGR00255 family)